MRSRKEPRTGRKRPAVVLVVEDQADISDLMREVLQDDGYLVVRRSNGQTGLETAMSLHPDVIILDIMLPGMDGVDVLRTLKSSPRTRDIPVIVSSAVVDWLPQLKNQAAYALLPKPFDIDELRHTVQIAIDSRLANAADGTRLRWLLNRPSRRSQLTGITRALAGKVIGWPRWSWKAS